MNQIEKMIVEKLRNLCPEAERFEVRGIIDRHAYSIEFYVIRNDEKKQCYEMIDRGELDGNSADDCFREIAEYVRNNSETALPCKLSFIFSVE